MIVIGVCEDQLADQEMICYDIEQYGKINQCEFEIIPTSSGKEFWDNYKPQRYDIIFLDVYLQDTMGIDIAKNLRELGEDCALVFITSSKNHAIEGFELRAQHYLIKPITEKLVFEALDRCKSVLEKDMQYISIHNGKLNQRIFLNDIIYIEVFDKVSVIHSKLEVIKTYTPLSQLEKQLGGLPFLRCHRCSIINMLYVDDFTATDFIMKDGRSIGIRKVGSVGIRQQYLDFIFQGVRGEKCGG